MISELEYHNRDADKRCDEHKNNCKGCDAKVKARADLFVVKQFPAKASSWLTVIGYRLFI